MNHGNTITDHFDIITGRCVADMAPIVPAGAIILAAA